MARHKPLPAHLEHRIHAVGRELGLDVKGNSEHRKIALNVTARASGVPLSRLAHQHSGMHDGVTKPAGKPPRYGFAASPELTGGRRRRGR